MDNNIKKFIKQAIFALIKNTSNEKKITHLVHKHKVKIHFIPIRYRILVGCYNQ